MCGGRQANTMRLQLSCPTWLAQALLLGYIVSGCSAEVGDAAARAGAHPVRDPGYSMKNAEITETSAQGNPRYTVQAARAQQDPASGEIALNTIQMKLRDERGGEWHLRARSGRMREDAALVALRGGVVVDGNPDGGSQALQMRTEALDVDTQTQRASSTELVTITMSGRLLTAQGMNADLKARRLALKSNVHGRFTP